MRQVAFKTPHLVIPKLYAVGNSYRGLMATNVVVNGNFANGVTGWAVSNSTLTATNNILSVTGNGVSSSARGMKDTGTPATTGKVIYARAKVKVTNGVCSSIQVASSGTTGGSYQANSSVVAPVNGTVYTVSGNVTLTGQTGNIRIQVIQNYADAATANGKVMEVQEVLAIDLTALFGAGNEPTLAECDRIFATWFDGTMNL